MPTRPFTQSVDLTNRRQSAVNILRPDPGQTRLVQPIPTASFSDSVDVADVAVASGGAASLAVRYTHAVADTALVALAPAFQLAPNVPAAPISSETFAALLTDTFVIPVANTSVGGLASTQTRALLSGFADVTVLGFDPTDKYGINARVSPVADTSVAGEVVTLAVVSINVEEPTPEVLARTPFEGSIAWQSRENRNSGSVFNGTELR